MAACKSGRLKAVQKMLADDITDCAISELVLARHSVAFGFRGYGLRARAVPRSFRTWQLAPEVDAW